MNDAENAVAGGVTLEWMLAGVYFQSGLCRKFSWPERLKFTGSNQSCCFSWLKRRWSE